MQILKPLLGMIVIAFFVTACGQEDARKAPEEIKNKVDSLDNEVMEELKENSEDTSDQQ